MGKNILIGTGVFLLSLSAQAMAQSSENRAAEVLRARAEQFSGSPVLVDSRLNLPPCAAEAHLRWHVPGQSMNASCENFSMIIPLTAGSGPQARAARMPIAVKRGDPVMISASGSGFRVMLEGVAEANGRPGERIMVRNANSGRRVLTAIDEDGSLTLASSIRPAG